MIEDRELDIWREQWGSVAEPLSDMQRAIQKKINRQNLWFMISNLSAVLAVVVGLTFAVIVMRQDSNPLGKEQGIGIVVLTCLCVAYRIWVQRGTWRPETQSTRAFVELWQRRVIAKARGCRVAMFAAPAWVLFCGALVAVNWTAIAPDVKAHTSEWLGLLVGTLITLPAMLFGLAWYRKRKLVELNEVKKVLAEMDDVNG
jgi:hypothetical protein